MRVQGTLLDAVGRTKHSLSAAPGGEAAGVTVHGDCPLTGCHAMNVVHVESTTTTVACSSCGAEFDV